MLCVYPFRESALYLVLCVTCIHSLQLVFDLWHYRSQQDDVLAYWIAAGSRHFGDEIFPFIPSDGSVTAV